MRASLCASLLCLAWPLAAAAQEGVGGRVTSGGEPVATALVVVKGTPLRAEAGPDGRYRLRGVEPGRRTLLASAPGYAPRERVVTVGEGGAELDFELVPSALAADPLVVTGTRKEIRLSQSPVKVEVVPAVYLQKNPTASLVEALETVNGLYQQIDCGVCYTSNIRINGLEGPYTAVLLDGAPIMSSLASVYGLSGINPAVIEQVEVIKGPASTLYGSEAMAGVINVITRDPRFAPRLSVDAFRSSDGETNVDFAVSPRGSTVQGLLSGSVFLMDRFIDHNGDNFTDMPKERRVSLFGKVSVLRGGRKSLDVFAKLYREDRFGGVSEWTRADRGSESVYGESILTDRFELVGRYRIPLDPERLQLDFSYSRHEQDSWYGATPYEARQGIAYGTLQWSPPAGERHDALLGVSLRHQTYDDNTPATAAEERRLIPGVFAQDEVALSGRLRALGGLRLDHQGDHGAILSPRLSLKWQPGEATAVRLNAGTGFRVVSLFTEDHAAYTGARQVVIAEALRPERSYNLTLNLNRLLQPASGPLTLDVDGFYTRFTNKIIPDYDSHPDRILYRNLDGYSVSRGVAATLSQTMTTRPLTWSAGGTWMEVFAERGGVRERQLFAPGFQGVFSTTWQVEGAGITLDWLGRVTGPMRLPRYAAPFERPTRSEWYSIQHAKATRRMSPRLEVYAAVQNLFDYRQPSPLVDPENPFGPDFDTAYVYAPMHGRCFVVGARYGVSK